MSNGFSAADMSTAAASGHAEGYQAGYADAVKAMDHIGDANKMVGAAQEVVAWSKTKPTTEGAYYVRGFAIGQDVALVQVRMHRFDGEPAPELVCNIHESTSNEDMDDWWPMVDLSDDFEWLGPLVAAPVAAAPVGSNFGFHWSPEQFAAAIERIAGGALADYEGVAADESFLRNAATLIRRMASTPAAPGIDLAAQAVALRDLAAVIRKYGTCAPMALETIADRIDASPKGDALQDDRFPGGFADAIAYADEMEEGAGRLYEQVIGFEDGGHTGTDMLAAVLRELQASPKGGESMPDWSLRMAKLEEGQHVGAGAHGIPDSHKGGSTDMRTEFELRFGKAYPMGRYLNSPDTYSFMETRRVWEGWQAAMQATSAEAGA